MKYVIEKEVIICSDEYLKIFLTTQEDSLLQLNKYYLNQIPLTWSLARNKRTS